VLSWQPPAELKDFGRRPFEQGGTGHGCLRSSPPKRLLGLAGDIAPRQSDIVQVPLGPMGQLIALTPAVKPDMKTGAEPGQNARFMIICHILTNGKGHISLHNPRFWCGISAHFAVATNDTLIHNT
jgi:hypothetical protein